MAQFDNQAQAALLKRFARRGKQGLRLSKPPRSRHPSEIERQYARELQKLVDTFNQVVRTVILPKLPSILESARESLPTSDGFRSDAYAEEFEAVFEEASIVFARRYTDLEAEALANKYAQTTGKWNATQIREQFVKVLGLNPILVEPYLKDMHAIFVKENVDLITSIAPQGFDKVRRMVTNAINTGRLNRNLATDIQAEFGEDIAEVTDSVASRARLIARDQIAKYNGQLNMARQQNLGVTGYIWRTSKDERVRASHRALEGETFSWDDPPVVDGQPTFPGFAINCRCVAEPLFNSSDMLKGTALGEELSK